MNEQAKQAVFEIRHLQTWFPVRKGVFKRHIGDLKAVDDVSLTVYQGETLGIVGESGCGKSTLGKSIMRLENPTGGEVFYNFDGKYKDIMKFNSQELFQFRKRVQMVFQDPYSALNPIKRVYDSFSDPLKVHGYKDPEKRQEMIEEALRLVRRRSARRCATWACCPSLPAASRMSFPAVSVSGFASPERFLYGLTCWYVMSRSPRWMCQFRRRC